MEELTPKQQEFLASYTNPNSDTFGNALQSALRAGYSQEYSESLTYQMPDWLSDNLGMSKRLKQAEKVLDKTLEMNTVDQDGKVDSAVLRIQTDVAKFYAERIGKKQYSTRTELTGANGKELPTPIINVLRNDSIQENSEPKEEN